MGISPAVRTIIGFSTSGQASNAPAFSRSSSACILTVSYTHLKDLVERFHDQKNRRQVYIQITGEGRQVIGALCGELLQAVAENFTALDDGELMELKEALRTMKKLMGKLEQREIL